MRFMIIRKADRNTEAGILPGEELLWLQPSSEGARVRFSGGVATVIDGPFTGSKGLVAGVTMLEAKSRDEAIESVERRAPRDAGGEVEIEIREVGCPGGLAGISLSESPGSRSPGSKPEGDVPIRFMILLKADANAEAGFVPGEKVLAAMGKRNDEAVEAGVMLAGEGLQPSSKGARVKFSGGKPAVIDGPFAEAKELVAGFWLIQVKSKAEAIEWVKRYPYPIDGEGEVEIRQVSEAWTRH